MRTALHLRSRAAAVAAAGLLVALLALAALRLGCRRGPGEHSRLGHLSRPG